MATISEINQQLSSYQASLASIRNQIEAVAVSKGVSYISGVDTPITLLNKISSNITTIPTGTVNITQNGVTDCLNYASASVYIPDTGNLGLQVINRTLSSLIDVQTSISYVGSYVFAYLPLTQISLPVCSYISDCGFLGCGSLSSVFLPECNYIGFYGFCDCASLTQLSLPACSYLGSEAFAADYNITSIYLPMCNIIESMAMYNLTKLTTVNLDNCSRIEYWGMRSCSALTSLSLPKCEFLGSHALANCSKLEFLYIGGGLSTICSLFDSNVLGATPFSNSNYLGRYGSIYVPASLYNAYIGDAYWSVYASRFVSM